MSYVKGTKSSELLSDDMKEPVGHVIVKNVNVKWRMFGGTEWYLSQPGAAQSKKKDKTSCRELALCGIDCQYDVFPVGVFFFYFVSRLSLSFHNIHLCDSSRDASLRLVICETLPFVILVDLRIFLSFVSH